MKSPQLYALILAVLTAAGTAFAQQRVLSSLVRPDAPIYASLRASAAEESTITIRTEKSGTLAMALSAVLPGAGQVYAERYYTIPIIWGAGGFFVSQWITANKRYKDYRDRYSASVLQDSVFRTGDKILKDIRDGYHDIRDEYAIYIALTYILNIVDAYVGASLYGFDVSDDLGSAAIRFRVPIR